MSGSPQDVPSEHPDEEEIHAESAGLFGLGVLLIALVLLVIIPFTTGTQPADKAWFLSPRNLPFAASGLMILGSGLLVAQFFRLRWVTPDRVLFWKRAFTGFEGMGEAIQYSLLFCAYVFVLSYAGFAFSTWLFGQICLWKAGLRSWRWAAWNLVFAIGIVLILRVLMGLWFPQAPILDYAPAWFANSIGPYL
jgi:NADH:ubiquinone oxidoreductase subunit 6 (subunit J)